jgi:hypothetical protein
MKCENCSKELVEDLDALPYNSYLDNYCDGKMTWDENPYAAEINDDHELYLDCYGSRYESAMDI